MTAQQLPAAPLFVHLSDIHFDAAANTAKGPNALVRQALLDDLADGRRELGQPDAVLVTGDVAFSGQEPQYEQARRFLREVTDRLDIEPERVLVVPGNHDVDRGEVRGSVRAVHRALRNQSPLEADKSLQEYLDEGSDPLFAPLAAYRAFAGDYGCAVSGRSPFWEVPWQLGVESVLRIRGITTVLVSDGEDRKANLIVGSDQTMLATDARNDVVLVMGHHPSDWWHDQDEAEALMRGYASVHLYGHKHAQRLWTEDESVRLVAGALHPERETDWQPGYNWLRLRLDGESTDAARLQVLVWPRVVPLGSNAFRSGSDAGGWGADERSARLRRLERAAGPAARAAEPSVEPAAHAASILSAAEREPMTDESGGLTPLRHAVYRFGRLGYARQTAVLADLGLVRDEDRDLPAEEQFRAAFARAGRLGLLDELVARIDAAAGPGDG